MQNVAILGSTGSIGTSTLAVIKANADIFRAYALVADKDVDTIYQQCLEFKPAIACLASPDAALQLTRRLKKTLPGCTVLAGKDSIIKIASSEEVNSVMAAISGSDGLSSTLAAAAAGKKIMLANKESLVMAGNLLTQLVKKSKGLLLPTDSEHNAIFQVLPNKYMGNPEKHGVKKIILTASGGPFLHADQKYMEKVTPREACAHPTWKMGKKISVDSATLMNKGLEVIEAYYLFNILPQNIEVLVHPESIIHSLVEYVDGSTLAQLGSPDMKVPIAYSLGFPTRVENLSQNFSLSQVGSLSFFEPDSKRFPCLDIAYEALATGGSSPIYLNAANEIAVYGFLNKSLPFTAIYETVNNVLNKLPNNPINSLEDIFEADRMARNVASEHL